MFKKLRKRNGTGLPFLKIDYKAQNKIWQEWLNKVKTFCTPQFNVNPLFYYRDGDDRPHIELYILSSKFVALLDTGASRSVAGSAFLDFAKQNSIEIFPCSIPSVNTADGTTQKITGVLNIKFETGDLKDEFDFFVVPSLKANLILGVDFLKKYQISFDFKSNKWIPSSNIKNINLEICGISERALLSNDQGEKLDEIIKLFSCLSSAGLGKTNLIEHFIDTGNQKPFKVNPFPLSPAMQKHLNLEIDKMLELNVIKPSKSPWSSPVLLVRKKSGEYRFCFDGRRLNAITKNDAYPLPRLNSILDKLREARFISSVDLKSAFWQVPLEASSQEKTAFSVLGRGLFEFSVMPFGLNNAAQTQQRLMDAIFGPEMEPNVFVYLDDIIVVNNNFEEHIKTLREVYNRLKNAGLTVNVEKCEFCRKSLKYLGYVVDERGLHTDPDKVSAVVNYPVPRTTTEIKRFMGMCSWYRRFVNNFSTIVAPINELLRGKKKGNQIQWSKEAEASFAQIKNALISAPVLSAPDFNNDFIVQSDASNVGIGAVLTQVMSDGEEHVIAYASRTLSKAERNYTVTERECLALVFAVEKFRPYIEGTKFKAITDHYALLWLTKMQDPVGRLARWAMKLSQYDMTLEHRKGNLHVVPDALSRLPVISALDSPGSILDSWYNKLKSDIESKPINYPRFRIENGYIYKFFDNENQKFPLNNPVWKRIIPRDERTSVLKLAHDEPNAAHFGYFKTLQRLREQFYWPHMKNDVLKYVRSCKVCGAQKSPNTQRAGLMGRQKRVDFPFQIISLDLIGPLPRSKKGNTNLLVVTDWFSKFVFVEPLRKATATEIVKFLENRVFLMFGVPQIIMADNGTQFTGTQFRNLIKEYGVQKLWFNAKYHPQVNFTERVNRVIGTAIRSYIKDDLSHVEWDAEIHRIGYAIRSAVHEITGFSPNTLVFGRTVPFSGEFYGRLGGEKEINFETSSRTHYYSKLSEISQIFSKVKERLDKAYRVNSNLYNLRKRDIRFEEGDLVWRVGTALSKSADKFCAKLAPKYVLCTVKRVVSPIIYQLCDDDGKDVGRWHIKDLKPYFGPDMR